MPFIRWRWIAAVTLGTFVGLWMAGCSSLSASSRYKLSIHTSGKDRLDVVVIGHTPSQHLMVVELECAHFYSRSQREIEEGSKSHTFTLHRALHGVGDGIDQTVIAVTVVDAFGKLLARDIGRFYLP